jgi:hypothetical protein
MLVLRRSRAKSDSKNQRILRVGHGKKNPLERHTRLIRWEIVKQKNENEKRGADAGYGEYVYTCPFIG